MQYNTFSGEGYKGGSITKASEKTLYCIITVDIHTEQSAYSSAVEHIYTDALLSGAGKHTRSAFIDAVNILGASIGVSIDNGRLTFTIRCLDEVRTKVLTLFKAMILEPAFLPSELTRIKTQTINELLEHKEDAKAFAQENFENALYGSKDRRFTPSPDSLVKEIQSITTKDLKQLHTRTRNRIWTVAIGGNQTAAKQVLTVINACKKGIEQDHTAGVHTQKLAQKKTILHNIPSKQNIEFAIGTTVPMTLHHPDYLPFVFGLSVLGKWGGFTGRLMSTVREKEGLTYGIYAKTESVEGTEQGHYRIMTFFAPEKSVQGLTSTLCEIRKIHKSGITQAEYERFQTILKTQQTLLADSLTQSIHTFHGYLMADFSIDEMHAYQNRLLTVTKKEINSALKAHLHPDKLLISGAGPIQKVKKDILAL